MEPYLIICNSCAARLKVTNEALFGQRLACPKCQTMIEVVAPEGFKPSKKPEVVESNADSSLSGNFEDIDSLLADAQSKDNAALKKPSAKPAAPLKADRPNPTLNPMPPANTAGRVNPPNAAQTGSPTFESQSPMPGAQWDTESTKQKKRVLQIVMLALMALIGLGIGAWALFGGGSTSPTVANNADTNPAIAQDDSLSTPEAAEPSDTVVSEPPTPISDPESVQSSSATPASPTALQPQPLVDNSAGKSAPPPLPSAPAPSQPTEPKNPLASQLLPTTDPQSPGDTESPSSPLITSTENSLGTLSKILKGQGTSLKQIEDIAQIQKERALIGTPTYLIKRPSIKPVQVRRQLSAELSGWKLDKVPLIDAIGDLEMLSGIPVSVDPVLFRDSNFDILRPVSLQIEAITFNAAFEMLLIDDGLILEPTSSGLRITSTAGSDVVSKSYPHFFCPDKKSTVRLKDLIIAVTGINDWDDDGQYQLDVSTDSVTVKHLPVHQKTVADLLKKLNAAAAYKSDPDVLQETLQPLALKAEGTLAASPNLKTINPYRRSMRISSLLRTVRNETKLNTILDWENLSKQGWFPNTRMPGRIDEPTNQALLDQLGHAMEVTSVVIGSDTIMLTTFENAGKLRDIEVYSVGDVIDTKMKPSQLDQLITETMGVDQLTPPNATVIYFAECKCLVANAPQIIQRQLSLIVDELQSQGGN